MKMNWKWMDVEFAFQVFVMDLSDYMPITTALAKSPVRTAVGGPRFLKACLKL